MILILLLVAIIIGKIRRGKIRNLSHIHIKLIPLLVLAFLMQGLIYLGYSYSIPLIQDYDILIHFVSYILLFAALMSNFDNKWFVVMTLGMILNFLVIFLNGGKMPVSVSALETIGLADQVEALFARRAGTHQPLSEGMFLWFLADVIPIAFPEPAHLLNNIYSIGDFIIYGGAMGLVQSAMVTRKAMDEEENMEVLLEEEARFEAKGQSLFQDEVDDEELARLRELRRKREEETRRIFQNEAEEYFREDLEEMPTQVLPIVETSEKAGEVSGIPREGTEPAADVQEVPAPEPELVQESKGEPSAEEEPDWKIYTQDFANASLIGSSSLEEQIVKGENYTEEDLFRQRKYYTRPLHERRIIDWESDGYDWKKQEEGMEEEREVKPDAESEASAQPEQPVAEVPVDTTHPFIIVDGRIVENPHYHRANTPRKEPVLSPEPEIRQEVVAPGSLAEETPGDAAEEPRVPGQVESFPGAPDLSNIGDPGGPEEAPILNGWTPEGEETAEEADPSDNILLKLKDEERVALMKKMKERKEKGYSLVQVRVGEKSITFWKKDL